MKNHHTWHLVYEKGPSGEDVLASINILHVFRYINCKQLKYRTKTWNSTPKHAITIGAYSKP